ncbi:MAG TPA: nuclear transport factor 2 family protein [Acidimicrobiales bacterium]|nr:nuclear transport factor 2 family protein [Acidimicrobiales bacterium]
MFDLPDLLARESIRDLVARYNSYGDSGLFDRMLELFAPDAVLEVQGQAHQGLDDIRLVFTGVPERTSASGSGGAPAYLRHCTATHQIDLRDDTSATGRCYFFVLTAVGLDHWGRYLDEYRVVDGEWRFARRRVQTDDRSPGSLFSVSAS